MFRACLILALFLGSTLLAQATAATNIYYGSQRVEIDFDQRLSADDQQRLESWLRVALDALVSVYGILPQDHVRIRVEPHQRPGRRSPVPWGQVIRSHSMREPDTVKLLVDLSYDNASLLADWTVFHELSHLFIPYKNGSRWVSEGLASYYQNVIQTRAGLLSEQQMWEKLLAGFERARKQNENDRRTLDDISRNTSQYMRIHWHGVLFWLDMDYRLRLASNNRQTLDSALLNLKQCCEKRSQSPISIMRALDKTNGVAIFERNYLAYRDSTKITGYRQLLQAMALAVNGNRIEIKAANQAARSLSYGIAHGVDAVVSVPDLNAIRQQAEVGAASWALVDGEDTVSLGGSGYYSTARKRPVHADSVFRIGSISKTLLALASAKLSEQGQLDLDEPVRNIDPALPLHNAWPDQPVSTRMLLEHSSGLGRLSRREFDYPDALSLQEALLLEPQNRRLKWPAGYYSQYSNAGAGLVSRVIEVRTGQNFDRWFASNVFQALGMKTAAITWSPQLQSQLVSGYDSDLQTAIPYWHTLFRAFGGVSASARDMSKVLKVFSTNGHAQGGHWLSEASLADMAQPQTTLMAEAGIAQGRGMGLRISQYRGRWLWSHNGDADGYLARFAYAPASNRAYYVVINAFRHDLLRRFSSELDAWLIQGSDKQPQRAGKMLIAEQKKRYHGRYQLITATRKTQQIIIDSDATGLFWYYRGKAQRRNKLIALGDHLFRGTNEFAASSVWRQMENGSVVFLGPMGSYRKM